MKTYKNSREIGRIMGCIETLTLVPTSRGGGGTSLQEANGDVLLDGVTFSPLD